MAYSNEYQTVEGGSGTDALSALTFDYLKKSQIEVRVSTAGENLDDFKTRLAAGSVSALSYPSQYTIDNNKIVTLASSVLDEGSTYRVEVKRSTALTSNGVDYTDGSTVTEANLDDSQTHLRQQIQELSDSKATLKEDGSIAANITGDITGDVTGNLTGNVTGNADTVTTNANLTGDVTSVGNATSIAAGVIVDADVKSDAAIAYSKLGAIPTWNQDTTGNAATVTTNANLTGDVTSTGNATSYSGTVPITKGGTGATAAQAAIDALTQSSGATTDHVLTKNSSGNAVWSAAPGAASGEANTASNVGSGSGTEVGVFKQKDSVDLEFKKLKQGSGVTLTDNTNDITISASGGSTATSSAEGFVKLEDDTVQSVAAESVSATANRTYGVQLNSSGQAVVNVPWVDTDTNTDSKWDGGSTDLVAATGRTSLGLEIGTDVQAYDATILKDADIGSSVQAYDADTTKNDVSNSWTKPQQGRTLTDDFSDLTSGLLDFNAYQNFIITLDAGVNAFTNQTATVTAGQTGVIVLIQDSSASTATWASDYKNVGGSAPTLSSGSAKVDVLPYIIQADNTILLGAPQLDFS